MVGGCVVGIGGAHSPGAVRCAVYGAAYRVRAVYGTADSSHYTGSHATRKQFRHRAGGAAAYSGKLKNGYTKAPCTHTVHRASNYINLTLKEV